MRFTVMKFWSETPSFFSKVTVFGSKSGVQTLDICSARRLRAPLAFTRGALLPDA
jgi:hypothetical protein